MSVETRSVVTAVLAAVVAVAGYFGMLPLAVVSAVLVVALAVGWPALAGLPFTPGAGAVVGLGGLGAVAAVTITPEDPFLQHMALVLAGAVVLAFVNELLRRDGRVRMVESVSGTVTGTVLAVCVTGWVATARLTGGDELVVAGAIALALGSAAVALRGRPWVVYLVTVAAATAGGTSAPNSSTVTPSTSRSPTWNPPSRNASCSSTTSAKAASSRCPPSLTKPVRFAAASSPRR